MRNFELNYLGHESLQSLLDMLMVMHVSVGSDSAFSVPVYDI